MAINIDQKNCNGCAACMDACNIGAIYMVDKKAYIDQERCTSCGNCVEVCSVLAIQVVADVVVTPSPTDEVQSTRTSLWPTIKTAVATLGSTLTPIIISKIGDIIISALESKPGRSAFSNRNQPASNRQNRRRYRGGS